MGFLIQGEFTCIPGKELANGSLKNALHLELHQKKKGRAPSTVPAPSWLNTQNSAHFEAELLLGVLDGDLFGDFGELGLETPSVNPLPLNDDL